MEFFFADDARQDKPTRPGMGPLIAIGGIHVPDLEVRKLERELDEMCNNYGFPPNNEFKWSPGRELWMRDNLICQERTNFFARVLGSCKEHGIKAIVIIEDTNYRPAIRSLSHEKSVASMFLERVDIRMQSTGKDGIIIVDRPSGDRGNEDKFLSDCLETIQTGTDYIKPERIAINVLSTPSKLVRLVQVADLITSCTLATVAGEERFAPQTFEFVKELLCSDSYRMGGVGLKIHPDYKYANLYHWLLGDDCFKKGKYGITLPTKGHCYHSDPQVP